MPATDAVRVTPSPTPVISSIPISSDSDARRRALARKLGGFSNAPPTRTSTPSPDRTAAQQQAADRLRRRYEQTAVKAKGEQVERYVAAAERALEDDNPVAAANALHIATSLAPKDPELAAKFEQTQREAREKLSENYLARAMYEERTHQFMDAANSYERAAAGGATAHLHERAAV